MRCRTGLPELNLSCAQSSISFSLIFFLLALQTLPQRRDCLLTNYMVTLPSHEPLILRPKSSSTNCYTTKSLTHYNQTYSCLALLHPMGDKHLIPPCCITLESHIKVTRIKKNDHLLKKLLIFKQILHVRTLGNV